MAKRNHKLDPHLHKDDHGFIVCFKCFFASQILQMHPVITVEARAAKLSPQQFLQRIFAELIAGTVASEGETLEEIGAAVFRARTEFETVMQAVLAGEWHGKELQSKSPSAAWDPKAPRQHPTDEGKSDLT